MWPQLGHRFCTQPPNRPSPHTHTFTPPAYPLSQGWRGRLVTALVHISLSVSEQHTAELAPLLTSRVRPAALAPGHEAENHPSPSVCPSVRPSVNPRHSNASQMDPITFLIVATSCHPSVTPPPPSFFSSSSVSLLQPPLCGTSGLQARLDNLISTAGRHPLYSRTPDWRLLLRPSDRPSVSLTDCLSVCPVLKLNEAARCAELHSSAEGNISFVFL